MQRTTMALHFFIAHLVNVDGNEDQIGALSDSQDQSSQEDGVESFHVLDQNSQDRNEVTDDEDHSLIAVLNEVTDDHSNQYSD